MGTQPDLKPQELYLPEMAEIVKAEQMTELEKFFEIKLPGGRPLGHDPGQFVEVSIFGIGEAPISISSSPTKKDTFDMVIRKVGRLTEKIHQLEAGAKIGVRGPYGKGFDVEALKGKDIVIVGGGIGLVPLRSLINYILDKRSDFGKLTILYGTRSPKEILFKEEIKKWEADSSVDFRMTVDRGDETWKGNVGVITTLIPDVDFGKDTQVVVCGPPVMYKFVIMALHVKKVEDHNIILSLERKMKCGVGKCGHCQINNLYVCQDGPVLYYDQIKDLEEAI